MGDCRVVVVVRGARRADLFWKGENDVIEEDFALSEGNRY